jgi:hypothetical protein
MAVFGCPPPLREVETWWNSRATFPLMWGRRDRVWEANPREGLYRNHGCCSEHSVAPMILPPLGMRSEEPIDVSSCTGNKPSGKGRRICHRLEWLDQRGSESFDAARFGPADPKLSL